MGNSLSYIIVTFLVPISSTVTIPEVITSAGAGPNVPGTSNGIGTYAQFNFPVGVDISPDLRYALIVDSNNHQIRKLIRSTNEVTLFAGSPLGSADGGFGTAVGFGTNAQFNLPCGIDISPDGEYALIADSSNNQVRSLLISTALVSVFAGSPIGTSDHGDGVGNLATFNNPVGISISPDGKYALVADANNNLIRKIITSTKEVSTFAGSYSSSGYGNGIGTFATFNYPLGVTISPFGKSALISDNSNYQIRKIIISTREVSTFAGDYSNTNYADGIGTFAHFSSPGFISYSPKGDYALIPDSNYNQIRKIIISTREVTFFAGNPSNFFGPNDGFGTSAQFSTPIGISISPSGKTALVTDANNNAVRKVLFFPPPPPPPPPTRKSLRA